MQRTCRGDYLPINVLDTTCDFLDFPDLFRSMQTCARWRKVARDHTTFSAFVDLRSLTPGQFKLFVTRITHAQSRLGSLHVYVNLRNDSDSRLSSYLFEALRDVWQRMRAFYIHTRDAVGTLKFLTIPSPRLRELEVGLLLDGNDVTTQPQLPRNFLGGSAPKLRVLMLQEISLSKSDTALLSALFNVQRLTLTAATAASLAMVPSVFPLLHSLRIVDPLITAPVPKAQANALRALDKIPSITIDLRIAPHWVTNLLSALPLSTIPKLVLLTTLDQRYRTPPEAFHAIMDALPGDLEVYMCTAPNDPTAANLLMRSVNGPLELEREFRVQRLQWLRLPDRICVRIVDLTIDQPDWDRTCFWEYALMGLQTLSLIFRGRAAFFDLLRREYRRRPVPVPFLRMTEFALYPEDVDFGELYRWLRKGTVEPPNASQQKFRGGGMRLRGRAETADGEIVIGGNEPTPRKLRQKKKEDEEMERIVTVARKEMLETIRREGFSFHKNHTPHQWPLRFGTVCTVGRQSPKGHWPNKHLLMPTFDSV